MGTFEKFRENILGEDTLSLIFKSSEEKSTDDSKILLAKIENLKKLELLHAKAPYALRKKIMAEIALSECAAGIKPALVSECGIGLNIAGLTATSVAINSIFVKGFDSNFGMNLEDVAKTHLASSLKTFWSYLISQKSLNPEEIAKLEDKHLCEVLPWESFDVTYIPKQILELINNLSTNLFVNLLMLAHFMPNKAFSDEILLLTRCADGHCRIAAHWGPEPLSFKIKGLHIK